MMKNLVNLVFFSAILAVLCACVTTEEQVRRDRVMHEAWKSSDYDIIVGRQDPTMQLAATMKQDGIYCKDRYFDGYDKAAGTADQKFEAARAAYVDCWDKKGFSATKVEPGGSALIRPKVKQ